MATVASTRMETARAKTLRLALRAPVAYLPGQHFVLRLRAPDGYTAQRSYSAASPPDGNVVELTVERLPDGEVSAFLHDEVVAGDRLELRGPIGGHFAWDGRGPALLVGGGSGLVPLMAMLRLARLIGRSDLVRAVVSARGPEELLYASELPGPEVRIAYTRRAPPDDARPPGRLRPADVAWALDPRQTIYVCGSAAFCDHATALLTAAGAEARRIRVERFGPTG